MRIGGILGELISLRDDWIKDDERFTMIFVFRFRQLGGYWCCFIKRGISRIKHFCQMLYLSNALTSCQN